MVQLRTALPSSRSVCTRLSSPHGTGVPCRARSAPRPQQVNASVRTSAVTDCKPTLTVRHPRVLFSGWFQGEISVTKQTGPWLLRGQIRDSGPGRRGPRRGRLETSRCVRTGGSERKEGDGHGREPPVTQLLREGPFVFMLGHREPRLVREQGTAAADGSPRECDSLKRKAGGICPPLCPASANGGFSAPFAFLWRETQNKHAKTWESLAGDHSKESPVTWRERRQGLTALLKLTPKRVKG